MSNMEINNVLAQMRSMSAELKAPAETSAVPSDNFSKVMTDAIKQVNEQQSIANDMATGFQTGTGDASVAEVMVQMQKASLSFQAMTEVRNKLVEAYKEVMNMPI